VAGSGKCAGAVLEAAGPTYFWFVRDGCN
jgi:hypothetical protein